MIRDPDGTGGWTGQTGGSVNACNSVPTPTIPDFDYVVDGDDCNNSLFIKGIINPHPNTVSCPNTDAQAATIEHEIQITCPTVDMNPDSIEICSDALPAVLILTTTGFADGTDVNFYYTVNGVATISTATVNSNTTNLNITESGEIVLTEVEPVSGASCSAVTSDTAYVTVLTTPSAPSISSANIICDATTVLLSSTGATTYEWSYNNSFTPIEATAEDFLANAPSTVFARAINQDDDGSLVCTSPSNSIVLTTTPCPDITYPIELIDFYGYWEHHEVKLHWTTATELDNDYFEIERSLNGIDYEYLTTVDGAGNSIQHRNYHAVDPNPKMGWNYYKLYQVDFDGTRNEVGIVVVSVNEEVLDWVIYPVPVEDELIIRLADDMAIEGTTLTIYNSLGQIMVTQILDTSTNIYTINTDDWAAGVYTVKMSDIVRERTQKIIKY